MNDLSLATAEELRTLATQLVLGKTERGKVDFKRDISVQTAEQKVEFCKDLSAIANSDDERLEGCGLIIVGAEPGKLLGGVTAWSKDKADNFSASLTDLVKTYIAPVPLFNFVPFHEADIGSWGVIVVPPSCSQPHIFIKEFLGKPARHDWFVRVNDTTERAGALDYARVMQKAVSRALKPVEMELQRLSLRLERLEERSALSADILATIGRSEGVSCPLPPVEQLTPVAQLRSQLATPESRVEGVLANTALEVRAMMLENRPENPQTFSSDQPDVLLKPIEYMEAGTRNLSEAIALLVRSDSSLRFSQSVVDAVEIIAEKPQLQGSHWQHMRELRLYPLILCLYTLATVSAAKRDGRLMRLVLDSELRDEPNETGTPIIWALRSIRSANEIFNGAMKQRYFEPVAERVLATIPVWCASVAPGKNLKDFFFQGEFALALEHMRLETMFHGRGMPLSGAYLYSYQAKSSILAMLKRRPMFLQHLFKDDLESRLTAFDENINKVVARGSFDGGFREKVLAAWQSPEPHVSSAG